VTRRHARIARCVAAVTLVVTAGACSSASAERTDTGTPEKAAAGTSSTTRVPKPDTPRYVPVAPVFGLAAPSQVVIPSIGVSSSLVPLGLAADGSLEVPTDFALAGWYTGGPRPGESGPAVIAGHVDSVDGPAVFFRLRELEPGDVVRVDRVDDTSEQFVVDHVERFEKEAFPTATVFGPTQYPELRLVTCGGDFDFAHRTYLENLVVFARPSASPTD
jgi:LPXTG-site transpeptidase (sortase) family protein